MKIKSITDVITNSSSEVFIVKKEDIAKQDLKKFNTYESVDEIYELAKKYNPDHISWEVGDLINMIYYIIKSQEQDFEYYFDLNSILSEYDIGGLSKQLGYNLVDTLKFIEPLWRDRILNYGFSIWEDDNCKYPFSQEYMYWDRV